MMASQMQRLIVVSFLFCCLLTFLFFMHQYWRPHWSNRLFMVWGAYPPSWHGWVPVISQLSLHFPFAADADYFLKSDFRLSKCSYKVSTASSSLNGPEEHQTSLSGYGQWLEHSTRSSAISTWTGRCILEVKPLPATDLSIHIQATMLKLQNNAINTRDQQKWELYKEGSERGQNWQKVRN